LRVSPERQDDLASFQLSALSRYLALRAINIFGCRQATLLKHHIGFSESNMIQFIAFQKLNLGIGGLNHQNIAKHYFSVLKRFVEFQNSRNNVETP
jgi:hypothetical protein